MAIYHSFDYATALKSKFSTGDHSPSATTFGKIEYAKGVHTVHGVKIKQRFEPWQWVVIVGAALFAAFVVESLGLSPKWESAIGNTVALVLVLLLVFRPMWKDRRFWQVFGLLFTLHVVGWLILLEAVLVNTRSFAGLYAIIGGVAEGVLFGLIIIKRLSNSPSHAEVGPTSPD